MGSASSGLMSRKRGKTHPLRTPNRSPKLCDGEEPGCQTPSSPCCPIFGNSKAQPMDNFPYPRLSINGKPQRPPSKPAPRPPLPLPVPLPPTQYHVPRTSHSQDTPFKHTYDGTKRTPQSPPTDTALPSVPFKVRLQPTKPKKSPDTPPSLSYLYDGRAQTVQGETLTKVLDPLPVTPLPLTYLYDGRKPPITKVVDPQPVTPLPSTYLYDGLKIRPSQQPDRIPKFGDWDENNISSVDDYTHIFNKLREEKQKYDAIKKPDRGNVVPKFGEWDESNISSVGAYAHIFNEVLEERRKYDAGKKGCCLPWNRK